MPELPEVEVTKRAIANVMLDHTITSVFTSDKQLRVPFSPELSKLVGAHIERVERRAKYIVISTNQGSIVLHLGMTGHLQIIESTKPRATHDHFEILLDSGLSVRLNDSRRFGMVLYVDRKLDPYQLNIFTSSGPEPFWEDFSPEYLHGKLQGRRSKVKQLIMDSSVVVGVGNIYASEVLFASKINPLRLGNTITLEECKSLVSNIRTILAQAIQSGGTTIRDFEGADGKPGYFVQQLQVYGKNGQPCPICGTPIVREITNQRSTFFCPKCQNVDLSVELASQSQKGRKKKDLHDGE